MICTSIKKNKCGKCINQKLTDNCVGVILYLLHANVVHLPFGERVGLLGRNSIAISVLHVRTFIGIMSSLLAFETSNVA